MKITPEQCTPLLGTEFKVNTAHGVVTLQLRHVKEYPRRSLPEQFATPLSLIFDGPPDLILWQGNYYIDHPLFAAQAVLIVPIRQAQAAAHDLPQYQIIFS